MRQDDFRVPVSLTGRRRRPNGRDGKLARGDTIVAAYSRRAMRKTPGAKRCEPRAIVDGDDAIHVREHTTIMTTTTTGSRALRFACASSPCAMRAKLWANPTPIARGAHDQDNRERPVPVRAHALVERTPVRSGARGRETYVV